MMDAVLACFPEHPYPLLLAYDPDGLVDAEVQQALAARGWRLLVAEDNLRLWLAAAALRPWTADRPVLILSAHPLEQLPYDLWAQGYRVHLSLQGLFPRLAPQPVRELTRAQRERLAQADPPNRRLAPRATLVYLLEQVFGVELDQLRRPGELLLWLNDVHSEVGPLPASLRELLCAELQRVPAYYSWPLEDLLRDREQYRAFMQRAWDDYVARKVPSPLHEEPPRYGELFDDRRLQHGLGDLVRDGHLQPVDVSDPAALPAWARPGLSHDPLRQPLGELHAACEFVRRALAELHAADVPATHGAPWEAWGEIAWRWAQATVIINASLPLPDEALAHYRAVQGELDARFAAWLRAQYTVLAGQRLPTPHHVYHVPHWLAQQRRRAVSQRVALLVLDGLSVADWLLVRNTWRERHAHWQFSERLLLAQVPTITSVSRQALVSGLPPAEFADSLSSTAQEARGWQAFWTGQGVSKGAVAYAMLDPDRHTMPNEVYSSRLAALCLVDYSVDKLTHGASLGAAQMQESLRLWLTSRAPQLEELIEYLLERGMAVHLASDHGHTEAIGMGRPREGLLADTKGQRARLYSDRRVAESVCDDFPETLLWAEDGLLPEGVCAVLPRGRQAFISAGDRTVTHGGITLDEVFVPFVTITSEAACS